ncbi:MAG: hypothetical protein ACW98Y_19580 [Candidatus Thorarchaeota archaeon]|jgi:hypothetical protein
MMRASVSEGPELSAMIPKNHFASMGFFREEPLISWTYTKAVLFTAYDVYRSNDFWLDSIIKTGQSLKEALIDLGFPKENSVIADTGVFEIEAKKAGIARDLGIEVNFELSNDQIFEAYKISGADYFVAPDEIILASDEDKVRRSKLEIIKSNLLDLIERVPSSKVIGVFQGIDSRHIENLFDFFRSHGVTKFAAGGIIPLYRYDKELFRQTIAFIRNLTKGYWLHTFGLPDVRLLPFYLHEIGMDSVDTSMLLYMTARRRYLVGVQQRPIRLAAFEHCECDGCKNLSRDMYTRGTDFFVSLYIHNITEASKVADTCTSGEWSPTKEDKRIMKDKQFEKPPPESIKQRILMKERTDSDWNTADVLIKDE